MQISVVICTHNPRPDYLKRVLRALQQQTLGYDQWELLLVDNASNRPLSSEIDLCWHPQARIVSENQLGTSLARYRGFLEAKNDVIVWVDDDAVLASDYLWQAVHISQNWPMLGGWGAGELKGEFEITPPVWLKPFYWYFTVHQVNEDRWTNRPDLSAFPAGAGMVTRKKAALPYFEQLKTDLLRQSFGHRGQELASCEDQDMFWTMTENGWGVGRFTSLKLIHLIPAFRTEENYLEELMANQWCYNVLLKYVHGAYQRPKKENWRQIISNWRYERSLTPRKLWEHNAMQRGFAQAHKIMAELERASAITNGPLNRRLDLKM
jgi:glycosyltransferase involved in cell wall biosynthesis